MVLKSNQIVTVAEARKLLGDDAKGMTDEEIQKLIEDFDIIAQYAIKLVQEFKENDGQTVIK